MYLVAAEELYERQERWDDIIHVFRLLPEIDPSREFALEARSLRQNMLETIMESEATNAQIYALYHIQDGTVRYYEDQEDGPEFTVDYYGRDLHSLSDVNDGWNQFGYNHKDHFDYSKEKEKEIEEFQVGDRVPKQGDNLEEIRALEFYPSLPVSLKESYCNYNWYEIPLMKEWLHDIPSVQSDGEVIDWNTMRDEQGYIHVPYERVFDKEGHIKISMKNLESLHDSLAKEYRTVSEDIREGEKQQTHMYELKSMDQLVREVRKNLGEKYFDFSSFDPDLKFPVEREDIMKTPMLKESMERLVYPDNEGEEAKEPERKKAW